MGSSPWRPSEEGIDYKRAPAAPAVRRALPTARLALLSASLLCLGYLGGVLHHRCSGDGTSPFAKWAAVAFHGQHASLGSGFTAGLGSEKSFLSHNNHHNDPAADPSPGKAAKAGAAAAAPQSLLSNQTLRFPVCNGFTNQRLSILYGMVLAKRLGRAAVLPVLIDNGLQRTDAAVLASNDNQVPFGSVYDVSYFQDRMERAGLRVLLPEDAPPALSYTSVALGGIQGRKIEALSAMFGHVAHLAVDCPLFKLAAGELGPEDAEFVWAVLHGMRPNAEALSLVDQISQAIVAVGQKANNGTRRSPPTAGPPASSAPASPSPGATSDAAGAASGGAGAGAEAPAPADRAEFNFIHLRIENDWVEHCKRWESIQDGIVRDNCYRHTEEVEEQMALFGMTPDLPLYVASFWEDVQTDRRIRVMNRLRAAGYTLVTSADVFPGTGLEQRGREYRALVEYWLGVERSQRFIGNSVSTFAALGLMERRRLGRWAAYYNGGNIPLASVMPLLHRLPWVFTYNSWSYDYDYLLKGAVRSAAASHSFEPYCLFTGSASSTIYQWLVNHNVTIITHQPKWRNQLLEIAGRRGTTNVHHSHLFKTPDSLVSTFQRVDLPLMPLLDQYTYVLYTDADVYFRRPMTLDDFGLPLPRTVSMSYEMDNMFPYNAGVMLCNLPAMRQQYDDFIRMMLDNNDGLYYPGYGPADQGIINKFYERDLRARMLSQAFNAKSYHPFDPAAFIVHFHGPKPHELAGFLASGNCEFKGLCERSFGAGFCKYLPEWATHETDEAAVAKLQEACTLLDNPIMKRLRVTIGGH